MIRVGCNMLDGRNPKQPPSDVYKTPVNSCKLVVIRFFNYQPPLGVSGFGVSAGVPKRNPSTSRIHPPLVVPFRAAKINSRLCRGARFVPFVCRLLSPHGSRWVTVVDVGPVGFRTKTEVVWVVLEGFWEKHPPLEEPPLGGIKFWYTPQIMGEMSKFLLADFFEDFFFGSKRQQKQPNSSIGRKRNSGNHHGNLRGPPQGHPTSPLIRPH